MAAVCNKLLHCFSSNGKAEYFSDRLTRVYSFMILTFLAIVLAVELYRSDVIDCWCPAQFTASHIAYTNSICKIADTYYLPSEEIIPRESEHYEIVNYNFRKIPFVLMGQAVLFMFPGVIWQLLSGCICNLFALVRDAHNVPGTYTTGAGSPLASHLVKLYQGYGGCGLLLSMAYLFIKLITFVICALQLHIFNVALGFNFFMYKLHGEVDVNPDHEANATRFRNPFTKVVLCDYEIRHQARVHQYIVQCSFPFIDIVEHCLYLAWIWMVIILIISIVSGTFHLFKLIIQATGLLSNHVARNYLSQYDHFKKAPAGSLTKFVRIYFKPDMMFALNMITENGSVHATQWIARDAWDEFMASSKIHGVTEGSRDTDEKQPLQPASSHYKPV